MSSCRGFFNTGLQLIFNIDQDDYVGDLAEAAGVRVVVHPQEFMPFPEDEGISIGPGFMTSVGIKLVSACIKLRRKCVAQIGRY